ncbi:MAG: pyrroline-5-carboxylate reductase [Deltaproteobacteria bacterium]|nr:pyrroline-5-carboxylate reductase [Deltaproteobacteria bacterium]
MGLNIGILGCGKLGTAFARGLLSHRVVSRESLIVFQRGDGERLERLRNEFGCRVFDAVTPVLSECDVIISSVRPQDFQVAASQLADYILREQLLLSVMAGIKVATISNLLNGHLQIVRSMPNLPVQIGKGANPYVVGSDVSDVNKAMAEKILNSTGVSIELEHEGQLDAVTAISGSGPGYVFTFIQSMLEASRAAGIPEELAISLIAQTISGSLELWLGSPLDIDKLREGMRLKGGTTEAAFEVLEAANWKGNLVRAIFQAHKRAIMLGS